MCRWECDKKFKVKLCISISIIWYLFSACWDERFTNKGKSRFDQKVKYYLYIQHFLITITINYCIFLCNLFSTESWSFSREMGGYSWYIIIIGKKQMHCYILLMNLSFDIWLVNLLAQNLECSIWYFFRLWVKTHCSLLKA